MIDYTSQPKDNNFSINKHSLQAIFGIPGGLANLIETKS